MATVKIFKSDNNKNCLYYACQDNKCDTFLGWCIAISKFSTSRETVEYMVLGK